MFLSNPVLNAIISVFVAFVAIIYTYYKWSHRYWERKNLNYLKPAIPFGNLQNPLTRKESLADLIKRFYDDIRSKGWKHAGIYMLATPNYFITDLEYVKNIVTKDFQYFVDRGTYINEKDDPIGAHLFALGGVKWRNLRTKLTPTFTSGKMKMMFNTLVECEASLQEVMELKHHQVIDIKEVLGCFTTNIIGSCAFGLDCNTFKEEDSPFRKYGKKVFESSKMRNLSVIVSTSWPALGHLLHLRQMPKDVGDFFTKVVTDTVKYREENNETRKDFMQLLIELKNNKPSGDVDQHDGKSLTMQEVAAQCFIFFLAGFETSSTTMTFALYELAKNQEIQQRVRDEIKTVLGKHSGKITYEALSEMKYMNQVLDETLRKYPPVPFITRECVKDYKVPDEDLVIDKGTRVIIPIYGIHHDEEIYPDPKRFDPERFNDENKHSRHQYAHIPFGEGPRICIGLRFGLMQSKVGLTSLLRDYKFTVNPKTQEPLEMNPTSFILAAKGEIWLDAEKLHT